MVKPLIKFRQSENFFSKYAYLFKVNSHEQQCVVLLR